MFKPGDEVEILACELTGGRWTVNKISIFIGPVLCHTRELRATGR
ncbi:hypothetical protein AB4039_21860 [Streptomyces sp. M-16]